MTPDELRATPIGTTLWSIDFFFLYQDPKQHTLRKVTDKTFSASRDVWGPRANRYNIANDARLFWLTRLDARKAALERHCQHLADLDDQLAGARRTYDNIRTAIKAEEGGAE